jgi:hypothetical protein
MRAPYRSPGTAKGKCHEAVHERQLDGHPDRFGDFWGICPYQHLQMAAALAGREADYILLLDPAT